MYVRGAQARYPVGAREARRDGIARYREGTRGWVEKGKKQEREQQTTSKTTNFRVTLATQRHRHAVVTIFREKLCIY